MKQTLLGILIILTLGCAHTQTTNLSHRPRIQSWDQENLHMLGSTAISKCPAYFDAPGGNLRECYPSFNR